MKINVNVDRPWGSINSTSKRFIRVRIVAPKSGRVELPSMGMAFVLDTSGSMNGGKLYSAKIALEHGLKCLRPQDTFSITSFDNKARRNVEPQLATPENILAATQVIQALRASGGTNISDAWFDGFSALKSSKSVMNRILLLSDGEANSGLVRPKELGDLTSSGLNKGVRTSTLGVGAEFDEFVLEGMAHRGGGNFIYIENEDTIPQIMSDEIKEGLDISLQNVTVEVVSPPGFGGKMKLLGRYLNDSLPDKLVIRPGHMTSLQELNLFIEVELEKMPPDDPKIFMINVRDESGEYAKSAEVSFVGVAEVLDTMQINTEVLTAAMETKRNLAILEASRENANGNFQEAYNVLHAFSKEVFDLYSETHIRDFADLYEKVILDAQRFRKRMESSVRKMEHSLSVYSSRSRSANNRSVPSPFDD